MSFHPQQNLFSLGYHGSFCITFEWIGIQKVFIFMYLKKKSKCEKFTSKNIISESKYYHLDNSSTKFSKCDKYLGNAQDVKSSKALFVETRTFMQAAKKGDTFSIYDFPTLDVESLPHEIPSQYKEFKDMREKKNVDTLPKHCPYDCTIDLEEGTQPPFGLIYNLAQGELAPLHEYIDENLRKGSFDIPSLQLVPPSYLLKSRWIFMNVCRLLWTKSTHHQESVPFVPDFRVVELAPSCIVVHQD